jgi:hypothetical protein
MECHAEPLNPPAGIDPYIGIFIAVKRGRLS